MVITLPPNAIPIFGTVSVFSAISLYLLIRALGDRTKKDIVATTRNSEEYRADLAKTKADAVKEAKEACVPRDAFERLHTRFTHMEATCQRCTPLKESSAFPRAEL